LGGKYFLQFKKLKTETEIFKYFKQKIENRKESSFISNRNKKEIAEEKRTEEP
jgi:hypothetical protein